MKTYELNLKVNIVCEEGMVDKKVEELVTHLFDHNDCLTTGIVTDKKEIELNFLKQDVINKNALDFLNEVHDKAKISYAQIKCCIADKHSMEKICYINIYQNNQLALRITHSIYGAVFETNDGWYCDCLKIIVNEYQEKFYDRVKEYVVNYINSYKKEKLTVMEEVRRWME